MRSSISILEDDPDIGFLLNFFLTEEGYKITVFGTVTAFSNAFRQELPDLILMDVNLPDGNGITLCNHIKNNGSTKHVPILLMSANSTTKKMGSLSCADGFISKPFDLEELLTRIKQYLPATV